MQQRNHPLEKHREVFNEACSQQNINPIVSESLFNQISTELELAEALHGLIRRESSATEPAASRRNRHREAPAQLKLEREIEEAKQRADELRQIQSRRQLSAAEIEELKEAELVEYESKKKLKRTKDAAARAKRYRIRKANENGGNNNNININNNSNNPTLETHFEESMNSNSPEDLRSSSSTSFNNESFAPHSKVPPITTSAASPSSRKRPYSPSPTIGNSSTFQTNNFACPTCDCYFPNLSLFISHMRTQHLQTSPEADSFFCRICKSSYPNASNRLCHMIEHFIGNSSTISCQQCSKQFENSIHFRQHFLSCHSEIIHRCNICYRIFTQNSAFQDHMNSHMTSEIRYTCVACPNLSFETYEHFESHVQLFHDKPESNGINSISKSKQNGTNIDAVVPSKALKCIVCDKDCPNELALDEHRLFNHCKVPKSDRCTVCRQILTGISDFTAHMNLHSDGINNEMDCIVCRQRIRNDSQILMHAEYHLDIDEQFTRDLSPIASSSSSSAPATTKCSICNYSILTSELAKHYLQHASSGCVENNNNMNGENSIVKSEFFDDSHLHLQQQQFLPSSTSEMPSPSIPLICHCGQQFEDENELTAHALEHLNETLPGFNSNISNTNSNNNIKNDGIQSQSFDCPRCPKRFTSLSALQGHSHVHMTQRIFKCSKCSHTFSSAFRLQQHRFKHASKNDLKCRICDKKFLATEDLQSHMLVHESSLTNFVAAQNQLPSNEALEV